MGDVLALGIGKVAVSGRNAAECRLAFAAPDINDIARDASLRGEICLTTIAGSILRGGRSAAPVYAEAAIGVGFTPPIIRPASVRGRRAISCRWNASARLPVQSRASIVGGRGSVAEFVAFNDGW